MAAKLVSCLLFSGTAGGRFVAAEALLSAPDTNHGPNDTHPAAQAAKSSYNSELQGDEGQAPCSGQAYACRTFSF